MTEIEIMQRAKDYIDKLASGINPLNNSSVPENDVVREKRIATCFQYISRFLERDIQNAQAHQLFGEKRFYVSPERQQSFRADVNPVRITQIEKVINAGVSQEEDGFIPKAAISEWLESLGLLEKRSISNGSYRRIATEKAVSYGITNVFAQSTGNFKAVVYGSQAQQFIYDSIEDIVKFCVQHEENFPRLSPRADMPEIPKQDISPFRLTEEQKTSLRPFANEAGITDITNYLNSLIDDTQVKPLKNGIISSWLSSCQFLKKEYPDSHSYVPTPEGENIGIICRNYVRNGYEHTISIFTPQAQQYIFDNIDSLIEFNMLEN